MANKQINMNNYKNYTIKQLEELNRGNNYKNSVLCIQKYNLIRDLIKKGLLK